MTARGNRSRREGPAERRARRAEIEDPAIVLDAALRYLEPRSRSVAELRRHLETAGYRPALVAAAIERLLSLGMLDDAAFARHWIESRDRAHPRGERALRQELRLKGVDREIIDSALADRAAGAPSVGAEDADAAAAERLLTRHARSLDRIADPRLRRQRAYALLARNGFDPETSARFANRVADE